MVITAAEARNLVEHYNKTNESERELRIKDYLDKIYNEINLSAARGSSNVRLYVMPIVLNYKEEIRSALVEQGYKVKFKHTENSYSCTDDILISWATSETDT